VAAIGRGQAAEATARVAPAVVVFDVTTTVMVLTAIPAAHSSERRPRTGAQPVVCGVYCAGSPDGQLLLTYQTKGP
jgi:hypothetical protein